MTFLSKLSDISDTFDSRVAFLSNVKDITISDQADLKSESVRRISNQVSYHKLPVEPQFIGIGLYHLAYGVGRQTWFINLKKPQAEPIVKNSPDEIKQIKLNNNFCAALLTDGRIHIHSLDFSRLDIPKRPLIRSFKDKQSYYMEMDIMVQRRAIVPSKPIDIYFPQKGSNQTGPISCFSLSQDILVFAIDKTIYHYDLKGTSLNLLNEYSHELPIEQIILQPNSGVNLIFIDSDNYGYVLSPVKNQVVPILPGKIEGALWQTIATSGNVRSIRNRSSIFVAWSGSLLVTFAFHPKTWQGGLSYLL